MAEPRDDARARALKERALAVGLRIQAVSTESLGKLVGDVAHQGAVAAVRPLRPWDEHDLIAELSQIRGDPLLLVLDGVTDPHNLGACLRTADAAGVHAVVIPRDRSAAVDGVVRKVAAGAAEFVPVASVTNLARTLDLLKEQAIWVVGTEGEASQTLYRGRSESPSGPGPGRGGRRDAAPDPGALRLRGAYPHGRTGRVPQCLGGGGSGAVRGAAATGRLTGPDPERVSFALFFAGRPASLLASPLATGGLNRREPTMRHYEIVLLVHPDQSEQVPAMVDRYKGMISCRRRSGPSFRGLGPAPADVPDLQSAQSALHPAQHRVRSEDARPSSPARSASATRCCATWSSRWTKRSPRPRRWRARRMRMPAATMISATMAMTTTCPWARGKEEHQHGTFFPSQEVLPIHRR